MDSFTKEGVPWLLPIPYRFGFPPLRRLRITTGKTLEKFVMFPFLLVLLAGMAIIYYPIQFELFHDRIVK
jgi:hypothetical protein